MPAITEMNTRSKAFVSNGEEALAAPARPRHFTAPAVRPAMMWRWRNTTSTAPGNIVTSARGRRSSPQFVPVTPTNSARAVGIVRALTLVSRDANRYPFHA